jgi:hypothetical protein
MSRKKSLSATGAKAPLRGLELEVLPCLALGVFCYVFLERRTAEIVFAYLAGAFCLALLFRMAAFPPVAGTLATRRASIAVNCSSILVFSAVLLAPPFPWRGFAIWATLAVPPIGHYAVERYRALRVDRQRGS